MSLNTKQKAPKGKHQKQGQSQSSASATTDPRFASFQTDPRYRLPSKKHAKVQLDSRFKRMLKDDDFHRRAKVDRYGRKIQGNKGKKDLQRLYSLEHGESDDEQEEQLEEGISDESGEDDEVVERELQKASRVQAALKQGHDPARDGGFSSSSSDSDSSDEEEEEIEEDVEEAEAFGPQDQAQVPMGEVTKRIAVVNLDWDNVRAVDLMAVASSFRPAEGRIEGVAVYPSEFGRERMQREELEGPPPEIFARNRRKAESEDEEDEEYEDEDEGDDEEDDEGHEVDESAEDSEEETAKIKQNLQKNGEAKDFDSTALRRYQLDRLRYYYAVISCSSNNVAQTLYDAMDGREYLSSANFFDLRFIPDEVSFDDDKPRDECNKVPEGYRPNEFVTDALQHSKVRLTWDEDDRERKDIQKRAFGRGGMNVEENDMLAYVASASSDEDSEADEDSDGGVGIVSAEDRFGINGTVSAQDTSAVPNPKGKKDRAAALRAALGLVGDAPSKLSRDAKDDKPVGNLQITFSAGLSDKPTGPVFENEPEETTKEKYVRKERERKARRKAKLQASASDGAANTAGVDEDVNDEEAAVGDDGFDDPFFENPETANRDAAKKARKEDKRRSRQERAANEEASAKQRAELELLMADEDAQRGGGAVRHFDMNEIAKEEKQKKRRKSKGKKGKVDDLEEPTDGDDQKGGAEAFNMNVQDPRFAKVFESHEYAIDPNDPRYKGTEGMKALLEEGRKRRGKRKGGEDEDDTRRDAPKKAKASTPGGDADLGKLLQKVKSRTARA